MAPKQSLTRALLEMGREAVSKIGVSQSDSWENDVSGFGTGLDKTTYARFVGSGLISLQELGNLYHGDDLAARMVDVVPDEMLREGFNIDFGDPGLNAEVAGKLESLQSDAKFADGIRWGRAFGEGSILIGADDGRAASMPLIPERARNINYLYVMDGRYTWPLTYYREAGHPKLGQPETYGVTPSGQSGQNMSVVHESRLIMFGGATTAAQERESNNFKDYSVIQRAYEALRAFNAGWKAVEILLTDGHQSVFKMQGLAEAISSGGEDAMRARLRIISLYRSVLRAVVVDAGDKEAGVGAEDFSRNSVSFSDIPDTLDKFMLRLAAAVQIPVTILMGQSPAGMNATGESDFRWFYDRIKSEQTRKLAPKIRRLVNVLLATKEWQAKPKQALIKFPPLWSEPPLAAAQTRKTIAETDSIRILSGELLAEEVAVHRSQPDGYESDVTITDAARKVRESVIADEMLKQTPDPSAKDAPNVELAPTDIAAVMTANEARASQGLGPLEGENAQDGELTVAAFKAKNEPAPAGGGFGGGFDAADTMDAKDLLEQLRDSPRTVITGGPRAGKSTLAARASERYGRPVHGTDNLVEDNDWSGASKKAAEWFDRDGEWIIEGTATPRALRKWLAANPGKALDATVVYIAEPKLKLSAGQATMTAGVKKVWAEIQPELKRRGVKILEA